MGDAVGGAPEGWIDLAGAMDASPDFEPSHTTHADDTLLLYFTSGTTSAPKLVEHTHTSYTYGALSTMFWVGLRAGDVHVNISSPGWAKHAWSSLFTPWTAEATILVVNQPRFDAATLLQVLANYDAVMAIILPTLGPERRATYSPFLPVCPKTGVVLQVPIVDRDVVAGTISFIDPADGEQMTVPVTGGHAKLQWKADWAMRWVALTRSARVDSENQSCCACSACGCSSCWRASKASSSSTAVSSVALTVSTCSASISAARSASANVARSRTTWSPASLSFASRSSAWTAAPRLAASHNASTNAGRGAKYAAVSSIERLADAIARK